jgi:hypothetical protein
MSSFQKYQVSTNILWTMMDPQYNQSHIPVEPPVSILQPVSFTDQNVDSNLVKVDTFTCKR